MPHRIKKCREILGIKLDEYIKGHDYYHSKGMLCPHRGDMVAHGRMDEIMEDVQQAHDMLECAIYHSGRDPHEAYPQEEASHLAPPPHVDIRKP